MTMEQLYPDIPSQLTELQDITSLLQGDDKLRGLHVKQANLARLRLKGVAIEESLVSKSDFSQSQFEKFATKDCKFVECDLTATSFADSSWYVVDVVGSRCSGLQLQASQLKNIRFQGCKLDLSNFRFSKLENVMFEDCLINDIDFYNATLKNVDFGGSSLEDVSFLGARLTDVNLSGAQIIGVK